MSINQLAGANQAYIGDCHKAKVWQTYSRTTQQLWCFAAADPKLWTNLKLIRDKRAVTLNSFSGRPNIFVSVLRSRRNLALLNRAVQVILLRLLKEGSHQRSGQTVDVFDDRVRTAVLPSKRSSTTPTAVRTVSVTFHLAYLQTVQKQQRLEKNQARPKGVCQEQFSLCIFYAKLSLGHA